MSFKSDVQTFSRSVDDALRELSKATWRDPGSIDRDQGGRFSATNTNDGVQQVLSAYGAPAAANAAGRNPQAVPNAQAGTRGVVFDTGSPHVRASNEWAARLKEMYEDQREQRIKNRKERLEREHRRWRKSLFRRMFKPEPPRGGPLKKPKPKPPKQPEFK